MMKFINKLKWFIILPVFVWAASMLYLKFIKTDGLKEETIRIKPEYGTIQKLVSTTGDVQPQTRLEIKPSVGGRIEKIFVEEGDTVKEGQVLALLSSTQRSSLLDAAKLKGKETLSYWEEVYKPIPLVSPIAGEVIVRNFEPGQSVATSDAVLVLSDRLIVVAQIDETDIGDIKKGQKAMIRLDAYPDIEARGKVSHISFESLLVNNVTIYQVNVIPDKIPDVFRSGMSANVDILCFQKENALLLPSYVIQGGKKGQAFVQVDSGEGSTNRAQIETGLTDDENTEILSGISEADTVLWTQTPLDQFSRSSQNGTNPFMPSRRRR